MLADPSKKYRAFAPIVLKNRTWPDALITKPPIWASVDLRDGNQALIEPMSIDRKLRMFQCLVKIGFKQIEVGFPSASQADFEFVRLLIDNNLVPDDVLIQVLTQSREHLIDRTYEALQGAKRAIVHFYNATAPVMRRVVFNLDKPGVIDLAIKHAQYVKQSALAQPQTQWHFEYSPEMFSNTELPFAKQICNAVIDVFTPTPENKLIINLPSTVECATPNIFADQIEWMHRHIAKRDSVVLSVHPHNDRGTCTAAAELALMAGADRLEGCLFGNGERTGNLDLVNIALNMYSQGIAPGIDVSNIDQIRSTVEYCNQLPVHPRHPYAGDLVYTSFSGSHQDAIKKAFNARKENDIWEMPYLPIDPKDLGRSYEAIIRVNSQSGKGGISHLLQTEYGLDLPRRLQIEFSRVVQDVLDLEGKELNAQKIWELFNAEYLSNTSPVSYVSHRSEEDSTQARGVLLNVELICNKAKIHLSGRGNGPIDAFIHALANMFTESIAVIDYHEHAIGEGSNATAVSYLELQVGQGAHVFGVGKHSNILVASLKAIVSGINRAHLRKPLTMKKLVNVA